MSTVFRFPDPDSADKHGLLCYGGNLEVDTLLAAYSRGIFPWYSDGSPVLWWSPDPRLVLFPEKYRPSKSLLQKIKKGVFEVRLDTNFELVIALCAGIKRKGQNGTWITHDMQEAYILLHKAGYAHSVETYLDNKLAGGLYGVSLGEAFFGESMFYLVTDASKAAFHYLMLRLQQWNFKIVDAQQSTRHLKSLGAEEISRKAFLRYLKTALNSETKKGSWT